MVENFLVPSPARPATPSTIPSPTARPSPTPAASTVAPATTGTSAASATVSAVRTIALRAVAAGHMRDAIAVEVRFSLIREIATALNHHRSG